MVDSPPPAHSNLSTRAGCRSPLTCQGASTFGLDGARGQDSDEQKHVVVFVSRCDAVRGEFGAGSLCLDNATAHCTTSRGKRKGGFQPLVPE
eukprot:6128920-Pyramimonas_sp.AAC.1